MLQLSPPSPSPSVSSSRASSTTRVRRNVGATGADLDGPARDKPPPPAKIKLKIGARGMGVQLDGFNKVLALTPGGQAHADGVDIRPGDKVLGVDVDGKTVLCGTQALSKILPPGIRTELTLLVLRKRVAPAPMAAVADSDVDHKSVAKSQPTAASWPPIGEPAAAATTQPTNRRRRWPEAATVQLNVPASGQVTSGWPTPRTYVPVTPSATQTAYVLPRPPPEATTDELRRILFSMPNNEVRF